MTIQGMQPEVAKRLQELKEADPGADPRPIDEVIVDFIANGPHDEWTVQTARRIFAEDAEFFEMLGGR
jgi:hypothetical protein